MSNYSSTICQKHFSFLHWIACAPLSEISLAYLCWPISGLSVLFHYLQVCLFAKPHSIDYYTFMVSLRIKQYEFSYINLAFKNCFDSAILSFHWNFRMSLPVSTRYLPGTFFYFLFFWNHIKRKDHLRRIGIFTLLSHLLYEHGMPGQLLVLWFLSSAFCTFQYKILMLFFEGVL